MIRRAVHGRARICLAGLVALSALAAPAAATAAPLDEPLRADVDRDGVTEEIRFRETNCFVRRATRRRPAPRTACARATSSKTVFAFPRRSTRGRAAHGAAFQTGSMATGGFGATSKSRLRVLSTYVRPSDGQCCPTYARTSIWTYSPSGDRFTRISTRVERLR